ncbi:MAG: HAMP domain-containing protein [Actinobacteria bacterium]|nr:MAG: HAMP domain-containing protein [Actinomycetota bacterium]
MSLGESPGAGRSKRPFGVRLYLTIGFAAVALITAGLSYLLLTGTGDQAASQRAADITVGRAVRLADRIGGRVPKKSATAFTSITDPGFSAWVYDRNRELITPRLSRGVVPNDVDNHFAVVKNALQGSRTVDRLPDRATMVATPIFRNGHLGGALLVHADQPQTLARTIHSISGDRLTAAIVAVVIAIVIGFLIATAITVRVKRLARSAGRITEGELDEPLEGLGGRDEITDLGRALETMRIALRETFGALSSERDRLAAIFDALTDGVMVVGPEGEVRFSNPAAEPLIESDRKVSELIRPWLIWAEERGSAERDGIRVGERVYAIGARRLSAENAVLAVTRDRTDALRREVAEREFVSNAAHELRNPIAGISGAIEVLRAGAKDDPQAREHFLSRLSDDAERVSRLTDALLTLARIDAVGRETNDVIDISVVIDEAVQAVAPPDGIDVSVEVKNGVAAEGDAVLLRQVLIGLLTNAFKNTSAPGAVTLRARREGAGEVLIEVEDTGSGIAADEVGRVFERFYRGSQRLEQEGFGLGLSIAKRMVNVMGGDIGVDSEVGVGSTFWVRLPSAKPAPTPVA